MPASQGSRQKLLSGAEVALVWARVLASKLHRMGTSTDESHSRGLVMIASPLPQVEE